MLSSAAPRTQHLSTSSPSPSLCAASSYSPLSGMVSSSVPSHQGSHDPHSPSFLRVALPRPSGFSVLPTGALQILGTLPKPILEAGGPLADDPVK